ncbi:MAG: zinc-ribbon domain-containing protein [Anaerolineae bacterium]|jgi:hypothetical protein
MMGIGSILVGIAALAVIAAYLAQPFLSGATISDRVIEAWVAEVRPSEGAPGDRVKASGRSDDLPPGGADVNYCSQCGRRVQDDDRFCSGCGTKLRKAS